MRTTKILARIALSMTLLMAVLGAVTSWAATPVPSFWRWDTQGSGVCVQTYIDRLTAEEVMDAYIQLIDSCHYVPPPTNTLLQCVYQPVGQNSPNVGISHCYVHGCVTWPWGETDCVTDDKPVSKICPGGSLYNDVTHDCDCPAGTDWSIDYNACTADRDRVHGQPPDCRDPRFGHPIYPLTGAKTLREEVIRWGLGGQLLTLDYDSSAKIPSNKSSFDKRIRPLPSFGPLWSSNLHKGLLFQSNPTSPVTVIQASRGGGLWITYTAASGGGWQSDGTTDDRLNFDNGHWHYLDASQRAEEVYDNVGKLQSIHYSDGVTLNYAYSDTTTPATVAPGEGLLISVTDPTGRSVRFEYESAADAQIRVKRIIDPAGQVTVADYDGNGHLARLTWSDGKSRQFLHERSDIAWAVTGVIDENNVRLASYGYDAQGRAIDTQWAGGADHYSVSYASPPSWYTVESYDAVTQIIWRDHYWQAPQGTSITLPNNSVSSMNSAVVKGTPRLVSQSQPAGSGCAASTSMLTYDANGDKDSEDDFNGQRTCYVNDRHRETVRVEGLVGGAGAAACSSVTGVGVALPLGSRKISTTWHQDWRLPVQRAEPGKLTTWIYHGQPNPLNPNAPGDCAPTGVTLPSGKPLAVLCERVEQATTDTDGHLGFAAGLLSGVPSRVRDWLYDANGQLLAVADALGRHTRYTYHTTSTADHAIGDLESITDPALHVTTFDKFNGNGQLLQSTDANGVVTINTYDPRGRLLTTSAGGQMTTYTYDPVGQLTKVTLPDASWVGYEYDAAHRRTAALDSLGNRIEYTLDSMGNVTMQNVKDPGGTLRRTLGQSIDALGRVQQATGGV